MKSNLTRYWLMIGVVALAVAGLYSLTLVVGRAPVFSENADIQRIFKDALVVHVDLSVLVWFLSVACLFWSMAAAGARSIIPYVEEAALICFALTILCMMASPFDPQAVALMSNYIPMISSPLFMLSLGFLLAGVGLMVVLSSSGLTRGSILNERMDPRLRGDDLVRFAISSAALITVIALSCFFWSYHLMPSVIEGEQYFDLLFWGGGHVLQLTHTQFVMAVWLLLSGQWAVGSGPNKIWRVLLWVNLALAVLSPLAYFLYDVTGSEFRAFFTHGIMTIGGIPPALVALYVLWMCWKHKQARRGEHRALWSAAVVSTLLFLYGGVLALLISGQNVVIPAHYHGSIVGITIAFMGFAYYMLPRLGYKAVAHTRLAYNQPIILGIGQLMHVSGLAYSGGYGVLRKTAGGVGDLAPNIKIALGFMGAGGVLAIAGGLMFIIVMIRGLTGAGRSANT